MNEKRRLTRRIIISRHGKPALDRNVGPKLNWREYQEWWARYEAGSLLEPQYAPDRLIDIVKACPVVLASIRPRAIESAQKATGRSDVETSDLFVEANLPPPTWPSMSFLPKSWNVLSRIVWMLGHKLDGEGVKEAEKRAVTAAHYLVERSENGDVYLAAHGWFNRMMKPELRRQGFKCTYDGGDSYWAFRIFEKSE